MIIINNDNEDMTVGSKRFTDAVADAIRPHLKNFLNEEQQDDFEGEVLHVALWWDRYTQEQFMHLFHLIEGADLEGFETDKQELLETMQQDPRFILS